MSQRFKVGDKVVRLYDDFNEFKVGDIAEVVKLGDIENIYVSNDIIKKSTNTSNSCEGAFGVFPSKLRLATPLEEAML